MKVLLVEPQKSKQYYTSYPPLGLLKLAAYHKKKKDKVRLIKGISNDGFEPNTIYITSLFTYAYEPVHDVIRYYRQRYRKARIVVGGIYATLCPAHLKRMFKDRIEIHQGLKEEVENILPDYSLIPSWDASLLFSSRGCIRNCPFCSVPQIEPEFKAKKSVKHLIYPGHKRVILWDNNILASPYWKNIFEELEELNLKIDFNQGLDARLLTEDVAIRLARLRVPIIRLAYDSNGIRKPLEKAITLLKEVGIRGRRVLVYCLYNHLDTPQDFHNRIKDIISWEVVAYPMRYEPLKPFAKNQYVSPNWTHVQLEMIAKARRVIGYGGAFPPYKGLKIKITNAKNFEKAFELRPTKNN